MAQENSLQICKIFKMIKESSIDINTTKNQSRLEDFIKQEQIGQGSYGKVYKVLEKKSNNIYAAKVLSNELKDETGEINQNISREVIILSKLDHPGVLKFIFFSRYNFNKKPKPVIITEYVTNGSLKDYIEMERSNTAPKAWTDTRKLIIAYGIASA